MFHGVIHHADGCFSGPLKSFLHQHSLILWKTTQHIVCQIISFWFFTDSDLHPFKNLGAKMCDDVFDAIVAAGTSFWTDAELSRLQADVIVNDDQFFFRIDLIEINQLPHTLAAQVHKSLRFGKHHFLTFDHAFSAECFVFFCIHADIILVC